MKKIIKVILSAVFLAVITASPVLSSGFSSEYPRVLDMAQLLNSYEEQELTKKLDEISLRQNVDVIVATTYSLEGYSVVEYADLLYEMCGFGYGAEHDGLMLLINMEDRDWYITTCGYGITAFTDYGIDYIGEQIVSDLSYGDYAVAFDTFADLCDSFITQAKSGAPFDYVNLPRTPLSLVWIPISLVTGFIIASVVVGGMKSELNTVRRHTKASSYTVKDSLNLTESRDMFLYRNVRKTAKPKNTSPSRGGSSTHRSSSGTRHGGGGGKF